MKAAIVFVLFASILTYGQERSLPPQKIVPSALGSVTLSLEEYNRLVELSTRKVSPPDVAPFSYVVSRSTFTVKVEDESVRGTVGLDGEILSKGFVKVPLISGLAVLDAQQQTRPVAVLQDEHGYYAVLGGPAGFAIQMQVASAISVDAGKATFSINVPVTGSSILSLDMPGNHANLRVEPGLITRRDSADGRTRIEASLEPGKTARISWTTREAAAPVTQREARFLSDVKEVISVGESESRVAALCDVAVVQGDPAEFRIPLPAGYELTEATGATLESSEIQSGTVVLRVREPARRSHQFLIAIERASRAEKLDAPLLGFAGTQRETGEVLVEGAGIMELNATESGGLKRMDFREVNPVTRSLTRSAMYAAFRYHRRPGDSPALALEWKRFADSAVLSAIAERATITTLLNVEGKSLTEVNLTISNHAQPFLKVSLPAGATLLTAEVEGERVKPVQGSDGSRVPLLRAGFRPSGAYTVSFVYLSAGASFQKSGSYELVFPSLDLPVSLVSWEVFLPDRLEVRQFGGNATAASLLPTGAIDLIADGRVSSDEDDSAFWNTNGIELGSLSAGQIGGIVVDANGAVIRGAVVTLSNNQTGARQVAQTDAEGHWMVSGVNSGPTNIKIEANGFKSFRQELDVTSSRPTRMGVTLDVGGTTETVNITASTSSLERESRKLEEQVQRQRDAQLNAPSQNVLNLQKRVAGILPVRVEVPRAGKSYRFVRPLVIDEETKITFQYKRS